MNILAHAGAAGCVLLVWHKEDGPAQSVWTQPRWQEGQAVLS